MDSLYLESSNHSEPRLLEGDHALTETIVVQHPLSGLLSLENSQSIEARNDSLTSSSKIELKDSAGMISLFDKTKAGLQKVDKEKTELIIRKLSSGSLYYKNEERKALLRARKVEAMLEKKKLYEVNIASDPVRMRTLCRQAANLEEELERDRFFDRVFVHIDMDMFYAAVEEKKDPQLREVPFGVGSLQMLSTTNYIARQYGVRSGMPGFIGKKLCPDLLIIPLDYTSYKAEAAVVQEIVSQYDPEFHTFGLDEQRLDLTNYIQVTFPEAVNLEAKYAAAERVAAECRQRVFEATQLTCSAGIGPTPTLAKMASNLNKPNGQHTLRLASREEVIAFMRPLPCRQVPGIGRSLESILHGLGITTVGDIYDQRHWLSYIITPKTFEFLLSTALGVGGFMGTTHGVTNADDGANNPPRTECKSVGNECTFPRLKSRQDLEIIAHDILQYVVQRLKKKQLISGQVVLKLKHIEFQVKQYSKNLTTRTDDEVVLRRVLDELLSPFLESFMNYRLLGVRLEKLISSDNPERPLEAKGQATLDRFFNIEGRKRSRDETLQDDDDLIEEETLSQRAHRGYLSHTGARGNNYHVCHGKQTASRSLSTPDVILIDSLSCSPLSEEKQSPLLTVSSSTVVMSFHESTSVSPPLDEHSATLKNSDLRYIKKEASSANCEDDVVIVE